MVKETQKDIIFSGIAKQDAFRSLDPEIEPHCGRERTWMGSVSPQAKSRAQRRIYFAEGEGSLSQQQSVGLTLFDCE
jgi:hypothetical protein